ncbi:hypothetical protein B0A50_06135 [Salinomyces thailandicus]|uniref:Uncharacterized protein n=1 Tax=Salinomyces thailandicus TaxID=706561 RepID=A0A4U0TS84_9PEZI|nr:hypothetical protein B0A50_06135 [Salinomyces thailandica]
MADSSPTPTADILSQVLAEYDSRISIDGSSKLLVSNAEIASQIADFTAPIRTPYGPSLTIATRGDSNPKLPEGVNCTAEPLDSLTSKMDFFTHAVFGVGGEDPKFVMEGLKWMHYALRPKGVAIVIALEQGSEEVEEGKFVVGLTDKITYQSKGKARSVEDLVELAGFERGKVRSFEVTSEREFGGKKAVAKVVLARKWDQLTG